MSNYGGLCLGGPMAGQFLDNNRPVYEIMITSPIIKLRPTNDLKSYYFVPLMGLRGFWLFEEETKGNQPFDDIIRILADTYIKHHGAKQ